MANKKSESEVEPEHVHNLPMVDTDKGPAHTQEVPTPGADNVYGFHPEEAAQDDDAEADESDEG